MNKVRIDKWLWSVRIFKSRSISTDAVKSGKVKINDKNAKPSTLIEENEVVQVRKNGFEFLFKVIKIIDKRVGAPLAITCYENITSEEEMNKYKSWFIGKAHAETRDRGMGRPTKKERREIDEYKTEQFWFDEDFDED
jgi:ribosome-associated heat shock protein Hsp15